MFATAIKHTKFMKSKSHTKTHQKEMQTSQISCNEGQEKTFNISDICKYELDTNSLQEW